MGGRLLLGTLCQFNAFMGDPAVVTVVGTWSFTGAPGAVGTVETRERRFGADPQADESAHGYMLLPSKGTGFILAPWGDVAAGDLVALT
jgi:hypothetical protein